MNKLKTLDEIYDYNNEEISILQIKEEAIKWIKSLDDLKEGEYLYDDGSPSLMGCCNKECNEHTNDWIKHFFNITDEELKQELGLDEIINNEKGGVK